METIKRRYFFVKNYFKDYKIATGFRSSQFLIKKIVKELPDNLNIIIEQGAGDGVMTQAILKKLAPNGRLIVIEPNQYFLSLLKSINDPRIIIFEGLAQDFDYKKYLTEDKQADLIISSIPFYFLTEEERHGFCKNVHKNLSNNGQFIIFHQYRSIMKEVVAQHFKNVAVDYTIFNMFPCFIIKATK